MLAAHAGLNQGGLAWAVHVAATLAVLPLAWSSLAPTSLTGRGRIAARWYAVGLLATSVPVDFFLVATLLSAGRFSPDTTAFTWVSSAAGSAVAAAALAIVLRARLPQTASVRRPESALV